MAADSFLIRMTCVRYAETDENEQRNEKKTFLKKEEKQYQKQYQLLAQF